MQRPEDGVWRGSPVIMAALAATFIAVSAFLGLLAGLVSWKLRGECLYDTGGDVAVGVLVALICVGLSGYVHTRRGFPRVIIGADTVEVYNGTHRLHHFVRLETTFHSMVNRSFVNGARGPGSKRMLVATPLGGTPSEVPSTLLAPGLRPDLSQTADDPTVSVRLPCFGRRRFSLLIEQLRTASTTVNLDEIRVFSISGSTDASYSQTLLRGTDDPGELLAQPARRVRGDVFGSTLALGRRSILLRALIFFAALTVAVALSVWLRTSRCHPIL